MSRKLTQEESLKKVRDVWDDHYDLTPFVYKGHKEKVKVICPEHGFFEIRAGELFINNTR